MNNLTLTSKIGRFTFAEGTLSSHAKLVRDTVTGQWLTSRDREPELHNVEEAYAFIGQHQSAFVSNVNFELELLD